MEELDFELTALAESLHLIPMLHSLPDFSHDPEKGPRAKTPQDPELCSLSTSVCLSVSHGLYLPERVSLPSFLSAQLPHLPTPVPYIALSTLNLPRSSHHPAQKLQLLVQRPQLTGNTS